MATQSGHLFISYARRDGRDLARRLRDALAQVGYTVWLDESEIDGGSSWSRAIEEAIDRADAVIALLSEGAYQSEICRAEQIMSLDKGKRVIPLLVMQDAPRPIHLYARQYLDFSVTAHFAASVSALLAVLAEGDAHADQTVRAVKPRQRILTAPPMPPNYVARPNEIEQLRRTLLSDSTDRSIALTALHGMGGIGKSVLATALCHDPTIQAAFPDGVMWLNIGREPGSLLAQMQELGKTLGDDDSHYQAEGTALKRLRTILADKSVLIVLDDVWHSEHVEPFRFDAPRSRTLFTTRDASIALAVGAEEVRLGTMTDQQAVDLLRTWARRDDPALIEIADRVGSLPLALKLAGARLREGMTGREWLDTFHDVSRIKLGRRSVAPHENMEVCFDLSVEQLSSQDRDLYYALGVFPDDIQIPEAVVWKVWRALDPALTEFDAKELLTEFARLALIEPRTEHDTFLLHDLLIDYTRAKLGAKAADTHLALLRGYNPDGQPWADISHDGYLFHHVCYHLAQAGQIETLVETVKDPRYLAQKCWLTNATAVEQDISTAALAARHNPPRFNRSIPAVLKVHQQQFGHLAHLLNRCRSRDEIALVLHARLSSIKRDALDTFITHPYLTSDRDLQLLPDRPTPGLIRTFQEHEHTVQCVAWSPDSARFVSGSSDGTLKVCDTATGRLIATLKGHTDSVTCCAWSGDGQYILSGSEDQTLRLWDARAGSLLNTLQDIGDSIFTCDFSPDGRLAVCGTLHGWIRLWDVAQRTLLHVWQAHDKALNALAWSPDGKHILSVSGDRTAKIWDAVSHDVTRTLTGHTARVVCGAWSPDSQSVVTAGADKTLRVWNVATGEALDKRTGHAEDINACAWSPDGRWIATISFDRTLRFWEVAAAENCYVLIAHTARVLDCAWSPDGRSLLTCASDRMVKVWEADEPARLGVRWTGAQRDDKFIEAVFTEPWRDMIRVLDSAWSPDGKFALTAAEDRRLRIFDAGAGTMLRTMVGHKGRVRTCAWSPDGRYVVSGAADSMLNVWNAETGELVYTLKGHRRGVRDCVFTSDSQQLVSVSEDRTFRVWDMSTGAMIRSVPAHDEPIRGCDLSPDGRRLATTAEDKTIKIWDLRGDKLLHTLADHTSMVRACAWSHDGKRLLSAGADGKLKLWDTKTGKLLRTLNGHTDVVSACYWSSDDRYVVSAAFDRSVRLWEAGSGTLLSTFLADGMLRAAAFHPADMTRVVAAGDRGLYWLRMVP